MYELAIRSHFDSAHYLRGYQGRCENLHGHRWQVEVGLRATELNEIGLAFDFTELKAILKDILGGFDHVCLNDIQSFKDINPSTENIARTIYELLESKLKDERAGLSHVTVWESPDACATYRK
ncbi:MAG: 6-carboxytetrahydropterin synthase QueD [Chloroflexi bacterium]|nr:6-carboxytetrahydropterin synthase QueD [Chloroflexota bacterium]MDA8189750.1 6-carboxytetrahydropterin synthase QueD [Dehalococcoidales bacterium]